MVWFVPVLFCAAVVYLIDLAVRRKRWKDNTKQEKLSLVLTLVFAFPYIFVSFFGLIVGITGTSDPNPIIEIINNIVVYAGAATGVVCIAAVVASVVLRKTGRTSASIKVQVAAFVYCALIMLGFAASSL